MGNPLDGLDEAENEMISGFKSQAFIGDLNTVGVTQYLVYFGAALILLLIVLFAFKKRQQESGIVPHGFFVNAVEYIVDFIRNDICMGVLGDTWKEHFPFLATLFFVILANNIVGLIPGCKPGTGTISVTGALALCSFVYFIYVGVKKRGGWGYVKSLAPAGVMFPVNVVVWVIEVFSTFLRLVTLAVRLFCNLFAGHVVMGTFAVLCALFCGPIQEGLSAAAAGYAASSVLWIILLLIIYIVEILVAVIQAYVFTLLSAVYVQTAQGEE